MSAIGDAVTGAATRWSLPWLGSVGLPWLIAFLLLVVTGTGATGMYLGAEIANGRNAKTLMAVQNAHIESLNIRTQQYMGAVDRGNEIADRFETTLKNIRVENKTFNNEVRHEVEKQVYIDCKLPESGMDLLKRRIDAANKVIMLKAANPEASK